MSKKKLKPRAKIEVFAFQVFTQKLLSPYLAFTNDVTKIIHRRKTVTCDHFRTHIYEYKLQSTYPKFILAHKNSHLLVENSRNLTKHFKISPFF